LKNRNEVLWGFKNQPSVSVNSKSWYISEYDFPEDCFVKKILKYSQKFLFYQNLKWITLGVNSSVALFPLNGNFSNRFQDQVLGNWIVLDWIIENIENGFEAINT
jgi:hypothetical protein